MKCSLMRHYSSCLKARPLSLIEFISINIIKSKKMKFCHLPMLISVNTTEHDHHVSALSGSVSIPWRWFGSLRFFNFVPKVRNYIDKKCISFTYAVLIDVVHCIMPVPATKYIHKVFVDHSWVTESIKGLSSLTFNFFPFKWSFFKVALVQVIKPIASIVASENVNVSFVYDHRMICSFWGVLSHHLYIIPPFSQ